jgi:hypothetical protein
MEESEILPSQPAYMKMLLFQQDAQKKNVLKNFAKVASKSLEPERDKSSP